MNRLLFTIVSLTFFVVGKLAATLVMPGPPGLQRRRHLPTVSVRVTHRRAESLMVSFEPFARDLPEAERDKAGRTTPDTGV
jgi:hypothetical protein